MSLFPAGINFIWAITTLAKVVVAVLAFRQRRSYPCFNLYVQVSLVITLVLWLAAPNSQYYFYGYYLGMVIVDLLLVMAVGELAKLLFWPLWILPKDVTIAAGSLALGAVILVGATWRFFPSSYPHKVAAFARSADRTATLLLTVAIAVIWAVSTYLQIPWRKWASGIAIGLACNFALSSLWTTASASASDSLWTAIQWLHLCAYLLAELIWIWTFTNAETSLIPLTPELLNAMNIASRELGSVQLQHRSFLRIRVK